MPRARSIHPSLWTDEDFVRCSPEARLLYIALLSEADDAGIFTWKPVSLRLRLMPVDQVDVQALLNELAHSRLIMRFEHDGRSYGAIRDFCRQQRPRFPSIGFDPPDEVADFVALECLPEGGERYRTREVLKRAVIARDGEVCRYCGTTDGPFQLDHIHPRALGGSDDMANLAVACPTCNNRKGAKTVEEWLAEVADV